jgi:drug/metabolite transporter (DMT)-like permease
VLLAVLAERFFGVRLGRRQWAGVKITAAGLAIIGLTTKAEGPQRSSLAALIAVESAILAAGIGLVAISTRAGIAQRRESLLLATAAGVLFAVAGSLLTSFSRPARCGCASGYLVWPGALR